MKPPAEISVKVKGFNDDVLTHIFSFIKPDQGDVWAGMRHSTLTSLLRVSSVSRELHNAL